jgi:hypothetical protein
MRVAYAGHPVSFVLMRKVVTSYACQRGVASRRFVMFVEVCAAAWHRVLPPHGLAAKESALWWPQRSLWHSRCAVRENTVIYAALHGTAYQLMLQIVEICYDVSPPISLLLAPDRGSYSCFECSM